MENFIKDAVKHVLRDNGYESITVRITRSTFSLSFVSRNKMPLIYSLIRKAKDTTVTRYEDTNNYYISSSISLDQESSIKAYHQLLEMFVAICKLK